MTPHIAVFDDFFDEAAAAALSGYFTAARYVDVSSPWDGVTYPGILREMPDSLPEFIKDRLQFILGHPVIVHTIFARITSSEQTEAPNQIHPDTVMGQFALLIYMSRDWPAGSGTSFWSHATEGTHHDTETDHLAVQRDSNTRARWSQYFLSEGRFNRALLYDARLYHCAEPVGGFGTSPQDGRIVLTCFFTIEK